MARHPTKEKTAMLVAVLASLAFIASAVFVYEVPGETVLHYLLIMLILLLSIVVLAAILVGLKIALSKLLSRRN